MKQIVTNETYSLVSAKQLQHNLFANDRFPASQSALYCPNQNTETELLRVTNEVLFNRDFKIQRRKR